MSQTTTNPTEKYAAELREELARRHEGDEAFDVNQFTDLEIAHDALRVRGAECSRLEHQWQQLAIDQERQARVVRTAARRSAQDHVVGRAHLDLQNTIRKLEVPISAVIYQVEQLPERPKPSQVATLKQYAQSLKHDVKLHREEPAPEAIALADTQNAEIKRLREFITIAGQNLHKQHAGADPASCGCKDGCYCAGCELIRGMDDVEEDGDA